MDREQLDALAVAERSLETYLEGDKGGGGVNTTLNAVQTMKEFMLCPG